MTRLAPFIVASTVLLVACSGDGTTTTGPTPTREDSWLTGTWRGTVTIHREGLPDTTGTTTWTFSVVPLTEKSTFTTTVSIQHPWLPITATLTTALYAPLVPGTRVSTQGAYTSPRGCQGTLGSTGVAGADRIEAVLDGYDCQQLPETGAFSGSVTLMKSP
jgi:hypothetical protein